MFSTKCVLLILLLELVQVPSSSAIECTEADYERCDNSTNCCQWDTPNYKLFHSCGDHTRGHPTCNCVAPGMRCSGGHDCCDGSICNSKCPPAAHFHYCSYYISRSCQPGLSCQVDMADVFQQLQLLKPLPVSLFVGLYIYTFCWLRYGCHNVIVAQLATTTTASEEITDPPESGCPYRNNNMNSKNVFGAKCVSYNCCMLDLPNYKLTLSCGYGLWCGCVSPTYHCGKGWRCCDGSECEGTCPVVGRFHHCQPHKTVNPCQSGLTCVADYVSRIYSKNHRFGRCL